ncbi:MAG: S8 family peptidase [Bacteroidetes bacterium]|nr:S8 family peptidase [Bacteroidota bacterium]
MKKLLLVLCVCFLFNEAYSQNVLITSRLQNKMQVVNPLQYTRVMILMKNRVNIEQMDADLYRMNASLQFRYQTVITALVDIARNTQGPLLDYLNSQKNIGKVSEYAGYWIVNLVYMKATTEIINQLALRNDIEMMDLDDELTMDKPLNPTPMMELHTEAANSNLKVIKADSVWRMGFTGQGTTVMNIDNGVNGTHAALNSRWWGNNGRPWYHSWLNVQTPNVNFPAPCGTDYHGSHTMGIMTGRTASGDTVGVSPDSRWMAAAVTDCPGAVYPTNNITAFQWAMNPDSNIATMDYPDAISCSWQDPNAGDQCATSIYRTLLVNVEAIGTGVVFSAGNSGPSASSITPPKNINLDSINVMCVGAVDGNQAGYPIASFSSRGPSICGGVGTLAIKPEVSAPGVSISSCGAGNTYYSIDGTSMASPHVGGAIALLKSVAPYMTGKQIKAVIFSTCTDLGAAGEDNNYGKGLINLAAAYRRLASYPLNAFNLQTPPASTRIVTVAGSTTPVTITWDTSSTGASYKFIFGSPTTSTRKLTISSAVNSYTTTLGALDALLASNGWTANGSATDSAVGQWDVWAFKAPNAPGPDSMKATNGPRAITFRRSQISLAPFSLVTPANNTTIITAPNDNGNVNIKWNKSGTGASYKFMFASPSFSTAPKIVIAADNSGLDSNVNIVNSSLDGLLQGLGVARGDSIAGQWRVYAYRSATDSLASSETRNITLRRVGMLPLNETFENATFPPAEWSLTGSGTMYWTRATVGGYGNGTASAKYDFWTATATTGAQTMTSNQFPAATAPNNYLRFNVAAAYYSATAIDSCIVETSTDAGTTWSRLLGMYQSTALTSGYNSTPVMSTVSSTSSFTPTATQWATKIIAMPTGTNKVRFTAKSAYGNNLYIDNITAGLITGVGNQLTLAPDKYELAQNYPNPFNPTTKINFSIPKQGFVTLRIYDVVGKEVAKLVSEIKTPGVYSVDFNASALASGIYFYRLESLDFIETKRMMLIK